MMFSRTASAKTISLVIFGLLLFAALLFLAFRTPGVGWVAAVVVVSTVGFLNAQLGIRARGVGIGTACVVAPLAGAALFGSSVAWPFAILGAVLAALVGYFYGASEILVGVAPERSETKNGFKSGNGGDFDGGGGSGRF